MNHELTGKDIEDLLSVERVLTRILDKITTLDETITQVTQSQKDFKTDMEGLENMVKNLQKNLSKPIKDIKADITSIHQDIYNQNEAINEIGKKYDDLLKVIQSLDMKKEEEAEPEKEKAVPPKEKTPIKRKITK